MSAAGPNTSERDRRACATEFQLPPVPSAEIADRPWLAAGKQAREKRELPARPAKPGRS